MAAKLTSRARPDCDAQELYRRSAFGGKLISPAATTAHLAIGTSNAAAAKDCLSGKALNFVVRIIPEKCDGMGGVVRSRAEKEQQALETAKRCAVVLGGTSGLGEAIALGLARAGMAVVASSRSAEGVAATADRIEAAGQPTLRCTADVGDRGSLVRLRDAVLAEFGAVDVLVNAAGVTKREPTLDVTEETWNRILDTNLTGTLRGCQVFGEAMLARKVQGIRGRVINIASLSTFVAFLEVTAYCCSKAAVGALTRSLAVEWAPHGVLVNAIAPGVFPTALNSRIIDSPRGQELTMRTPMGRFGMAEELVSTAVYLASPDTTYTTGQIVTVDGGMLASGVNQ